MAAAGGAGPGGIPREMAPRALGPGGGSAEKPVGLVWIALARASGETRAEEMNFSGDRAAVRDRAAKSALNMLRMELLGS